MQPTRWIGLASVVTLLAAAAVWLAVGRPDDGSTSGSPGSAQDLTAAELLQLARHYLNDPPAIVKFNDAESRVDILRQMAARRQVERPHEIPAAWEQYQRLLADLRDRRSQPGAANNGGLAQLDDDVALLVQYDDDLTEAALACQSQEDLDLVWQIKQRVAEVLEVRRSELGQAIQHRLSDFAQKNEKTALTTQLKRFAELKQALDGPVLTLVATFDTAGPEDNLIQILSQAVTYERRFDLEIDSLGSKADDLQKQLLDLQNRVAPTPAEKGAAEDDTKSRAEWETLLQKLNDLEAARVTADLASWKTIHDTLELESVGRSAERMKRASAPADGDRSPITSSSEDDTLLGKIAELTGKLYAMQSLSYNLWALREIQAAEEVGDNWDVRLAPIDTGLLHPTIAALYSSAYGEQIKSVEDPVVRAAKAQRVLSSPKIKLSAF